MKIESSIEYILNAQHTRKPRREILQGLLRIFRKYNVLDYTHCENKTKYSIVRGTI